MADDGRIEALGAPITELEARLKVQEDVRK